MFVQNTKQCPWFDPLICTDPLQHHKQQCWAVMGEGEEEEEEEGGGNVSSELFPRQLCCVQRSEGRCSLQSLLCPVAIFHQQGGREGGREGGGTGTICPHCNQLLSYYSLV